MSADDLRGFLSDWLYDPENTVRLISGSDGREIMQVRQPLGIEQYELDGRPDGLRPYGMDSALEYHLQRLEQMKGEGKEEEFSLSHDDCAELFSEGVIYYYRYLHLFQLRDWARVARDTERNLRVFDLAGLYAQEEEDRDYLEQWRPYIARMNAIACAMLAVGEKRYGEALGIIQNAIEMIESLPEIESETFHFERERSLNALREIETQIETNRPLSEMERLRKELQDAVADERYEDAATLRDRIRGLKAKG